MTRPENEPQSTGPLVNTLLARPMAQFNNIVSKVGNRSRGRPEGSLSNSYYTTTPFPGLLPFTLDTYLILLSVKQEVSNTIFKVFGMTQPGIEPWSPGPLENTLPTRPMI